MYKKQPVIFLDIDGVLNSEQFYRSTEYTLNKECIYANNPNATHNHEDIDPKAIARLNKLLDDTKAHVVVSSTWRREGKEKVNMVLRDCGLNRDILDITPSSKCTMCLRGNEILEWIKNHKEVVGDSYSNYRNYVIFDDDSDFLYWQRNNIIIVNAEFGLSKRDIYKALQILS